MFRYSQDIRSELYRMDMDAFAYRPPIEIIKGDLEAKMQEGVLRAVQKFDVHVDEEELWKALAYDRAQYEKGYADAMRFATGTDVGSKWISTVDHLPLPGIPVAVVREDTKGRHYLSVETFGTNDGEHWFWSKDDVSWKLTVTHWMPLPEPPKED